jgi:rhodanese-related sulfurtransferase
MKSNHILAILAIAGGLTAAFTRHAVHNDLYPDWTFRTERLGGEKLSYISASHLANLLYSKDQDIIIFDVRKWEAYEGYHIPQALLYDAGMGPKAGIGTGIIIVYDLEEGKGQKDILEELPGRVYVLKGGMEAWYSQVLFPDFLNYRVRNKDQLEHILRRSRFFGGEPQNTQVLNILVRESRYREGC